MEKIEFRILSNYKNVIEHGVTLRGTDFMHSDVKSNEFIKSKKDLSEELKIEEKNVFFINQVHGNNIRIIDETSIFSTDFSSDF